MAIHTTSRFRANQAACWAATVTLTLLSVSAQTGNDSSADASPVPAVFRNGAWDPDRSTTLNAYVSAVLSKDVYVKHVVDPRNGALARRNFTIFATMFCRSMAHLGADDCEPVSGYGSLVWAVVRAGASVLLVFRGSNTPQNWIADVTSFRMTNVGDFGGGSAGTNVALGFYKTFAINRQAIVEHVSAAVARANAAAAAEQAAALGRRAGGAGAGAGGGAGGDGLAGGAAAPRSRLWVFGHSLGGAVALMTAAYLDVREGLPATGVYTFGCPHVGDVSWAAAYRLGDVTQRLENTGDIIPTLPFGYRWRHVGSGTTIQQCADPRDSGASGSGGEGSKGALQGAEAMADAAGGAVRAAAVGAGASTEAATAFQAAAVQSRLLLETAAARVGDDDIGGGMGFVGGGGNDDDDEDDGADLEGKGASEVLEAVISEDGEVVTFPFPVSLRDHYIQTYVSVLWSCLPGSDKDLVPGPEDVYGPEGLP